MGVGGGGGVGGEMQNACLLEIEQNRVSKSGEQLSGEHLLREQLSSEQLSWIHCFYN